MGDCCGSQAVFNSGATVNVQLALIDGQLYAPTCNSSGFSGYTGETNNLDLLLHSCIVSNGIAPSLRFTESNETVNDTDLTSGVGGPSPASNSLVSGFYSAGEYVFYQQRWAPSSVFQAKQFTMGQHRPNGARRGAGSSNDERAHEL